MTDVDVLSDHPDNKAFVRSCIELWFHVRELMHDYQRATWGELAAGVANIPGEDWMKMGDNAKSLLLWETLEND